MTGSSSSADGRRLLQSGASVVAADIDMKALSTLPKHPNLFIHHVDVSQYQSQLQLFKYTRTVLGRIDAVYANAGVANSPQYLSDSDEGETRWRESETC